MPPASTKRLTTREVLGSRAVGALTSAGSIFAVAAVTYFGESGHDGGLIRDIWEGLKVASPTLNLILFWLYLRADYERREAQRQCSDRTVDFIETTNTMSRSFEQIMENLQSAVEKMADGLRQRVRGRR